MLVQLKTAGEGKASYASTLASLGVLYHGRGDLEKADSYYQEALKTFDKTREQQLLAFAEVNLNLATLCADQGNFTEALERVGESRSIIESKKSSQKRLYLVTLNRAGVISLGPTIWWLPKRLFVKPFRFVRTEPNARI